MWAEDLVELVEKRRGERLCPPQGHAFQDSAGQSRSAGGAGL